MSSSVAEMFARGYAMATALHPVGLTERARSACLAAERATESAPQPDGTPSLILGQLEGIWAVIYDRREAVEKVHAGAFKEILKSISQLDWNSIVSAAETQRLIDPSASAEALAHEIRSRIVSMISGDLPAESRAAWHSVLTSAITDATAEGQTAALGLLNQASGAGIDWELTATQAKAALAQGTSILDDTAASWVQKQTQGLGYQIGQKLARLWEEEASRTEMVQAIQDILSSDENNASILLDSAIGQALSQGSLATYAIANVPRADYVTAGDSRVCAICADAEIGSPYDLSNCPQPPLHPRCRCTVAPSDQFATTLAAL